MSVEIHKVRKGNGFVGERMNVKLKPVQGMSDNGQAQINRLAQEIKDRFGVLPNFFGVTHEAPEITANRWAFAKFGYLDNPLPSLFKERLFVYLSRFCEVRYCIARHVGFLLGRGRPAGDGQCPPQTVEQALRLMRTPFPRGDEIEHHLSLLERSHSSSLDELLSCDSPQEDAVISCASHMFLQSAHAPRCLKALRQTLGEVQFQHLTVLLAFVRSAHDWSMAHPELGFEDDIKQLLATHDTLAQCVLNDPEASANHRQKMELESAQRKQAERAFDASPQSEQRFRAIIDALPAAIYTTDAQGKITHFNPACVEFSGRTPTLGCDQWCVTWKLFYPDGRPMPHDECPMAIALKERRIVSDAEAIAERPDGTRIWFTPYPILLLDDTGELIGGINMLVDITERKATEKALRESEERFRMLADNMAQLAWTCDKLGNVTWYNQRWLEYTGMSFEEMKDWGWTKCHHPDHVDRVVASITRLRETGEIWEDTFPLRARDGSYRWFLSRALPIRDANGEITCWFGTNTDIDDLKQAREAAETANRIKDEFLATVSHELRTPLNAIMGWTHLLTRGKLDEETAARSLDAIARNASAQNQLISDLLDVSRIISGQLRFESGAVDLISVIEEATETVRPAADAKGIVLQHKLDQRAGLVSGDRMRLQQIVWNLLSNAIKFTPRGGQVTVRLKRENTSVVLSVSDTGEGIRPEFLPYIFDRFRQAESTSRRQHGGLGLGLAIVRHLVEAHGGTIRASSNGAGSGATFTVTFPLLAVHRDAASELAFFSSASFADLKGLRVLVIDDEADARELLTMTLTQGGAEVRTAATVAAALEILDQWKPHVLVSDIGMPGEDGYDLIRRVRAMESERGGTIPALALTGYATAEDAARAHAAGYQTHLSKPVSPSDLVAAVASLASEASVCATPR